MRDPRQPQIIGGRINADGSLAEASEPGVSAFRTPGTVTGDYTVVFPSGFRVISVTPANAAGNARLTSVIIGYSGMPNSVRILQYTTAAAVQDEAITFTAVGVQT